MKSKSLNQKSISLKIALAAMVLMAVAVLGISVCLSQKANASNSNQPTNASTTVGWGGITAFGDTKYGFSDWVPVEQEVVIQTNPWDKEDVDILEKYSDGRTIVQMTASQTFYENSRILYLTLYDNSNMKRLINFYFQTDMQTWKWVVNGRPVPQGTPKVLDLNTDNKILADEFQGFNVTGRVVTAENTASPIEGALVQYCKNIDIEPVPECNTYTAEDGSFTIVDIPITTQPGLLTVAKEGYYSTATEVIPYTEAGQTANVGEIQMVEDVEANLEITGGEHHDHFHQAIYLEGEVIYEEDFTEIDELKFALGTTYSINEAGVLDIRFPEEQASAEDYSLTVEPVGEEGYVVDKWNVNGSDLEVGKVYTITSTDTLVCNVTYKVPEPAPTPTPESETASSTTQTSDTLPAATIAIAMIALVSAAVVIRKKTI